MSSASIGLSRLCLNAASSTLPNTSAASRSTIRAAARPVNRFGTRSTSRLPCISHVTSKAPTPNNAQCPDRTTSLSSGQCRAILQMPWRKRAMAALCSLSRQTNDIGGHG